MAGTAMNIATGERRDWETLSDAERASGVWLLVPSPQPSPSAMERMRQAAGGKEP